MMKGVLLMALAKDVEVTVVYGDRMPEHNVEMLKALIRKVALRKMRREEASVVKEVA
jgi:hypothetical protein